MKNKEIKILLSAPRGFCAGVERAIEIVKKSINKYGAPVYVRHEIVHNKYVVDSLKAIGWPPKTAFLYTCLGVLREVHVHRHVRTDVWEQHGNEGLALLV